MTVTLFITILTLGSTVSGLITEAIKTAYAGANKPYSANAIALIDAIVVGIGGTAISYSFIGIDWTGNNILCMVLMGLAVWVSSMIGYDKVVQLLQQLSAITKEGI